MTTVTASTLVNTAYVCSPDTTGTLVLKTGATPTTALTISDAQVVSLSNALPVASGGTGATSTSGALTALGALPAANPSYTGTLTGGTGVVNLGSGQFYKDSSGNVGIGTSSPSYKLQVSGTASTDANADLTGSQFVVNGIAFRQRGNSAGISGVTYAKQIYASGSPDVMEIYNASNYALIFGTNATERARIDSAGNIMFGQTAAAGGQTSGGAYFRAAGATGSSSILLSHATGTGNANSFAEFFLGASQIGAIVQSTSSTISYNTSSDYRLKDNIQPMQNALAKVAALKPVTYTWKSDGASGQGFIAHELQEVVPDCVTGEKDATEIQQYEISPAVPATYDDEGNELTPAVEAVMGEREVPKYQGIDTSFLVATLTAAIQEQQAIIQTLTERITALENK